MHDFGILSDVVVTHRVVIVRADLNVPVVYVANSNANSNSSNNAGSNAGSNVSSDTAANINKKNCGASVTATVSDIFRISSLAPTINYLSRCGAKVLICSHFGNPKIPKDYKHSSYLGINCTPVNYGDDVESEIEKHTLKHILNDLSRILGKHVLFADDCIGDAVTDVLSQMEFGDIALLENLRFNVGEKANDPQFAEDLFSIADVYVNEAFSCSHRKHASIVGAGPFARCVAGFCFEKEVDGLMKLINIQTQNKENKKRMNSSFTPKIIAGIFGGSKVSTKIDAIKSFARMSDYLVLGGGIANTFLKYNDVDIGLSLFEKDCDEIVEEIYNIASDNDCEIILPTDAVCLSDANGSEPTAKFLYEIDRWDRILDVGEATVGIIKQIVSNSNIVMINGTFGMYEVKPFNRGTDEIVKHIAKVTDDRDCASKATNHNKANNNFISVAGGGDCVACVNSVGVFDKFTLVSTGGGALMKFITSGTLFGLQMLQKYKNI